MTLKELVDSSPRLTLDRLNNDACLDLAEYVLKDISHDMQQSLAYLKQHPTDMVGIIRCKEMLELLNSDYYFGLSFGHSAEVADQYENHLIRTLGYDPSLAYDMTIIFNHIIKREHDGNRSRNVFNVVIPCWDSPNNKLIFVFPEDADRVCNEPSKHIVNVSNYNGCDFIVYGDYYGYTEDPDDITKKMAHLIRYKHFFANKNEKSHEKLQQFKVSYMRIGGTL